MTRDDQRSGVGAFEAHATAAQFFRAEDGDLASHAAVVRMADEIDQLRISCRIQKRRAERAEDRVQQFTKCTVCNRVVDTREASDGGDPHGAEMSAGEWVCSSDCWDALLRTAKGGTA